MPIQNFKNILYRKFSTSFAKSGIDKMVFQLLGQKSNGFYLDIGSHHPVIANNTYFFYIRGWSGICVDPNPDLNNLYRSLRGKEKFINKGIGSEGSDDIFYYKLKNEFSERNSFSLEYILSNNLMRHLESKVKIEMVPLSTILENELTNPNVSIDFMSVDCEAYDLDVLRSNNWTKFRPKILISESHLSLNEDYDSPLVMFMNSVDYELVGKVMQGKNVGNLVFLSANED